MHALPPHRMNFAAILPVVLVLAFLSCHETCASQNITIDDTNLTAISYNPQTCTGAGATVGWKPEVTNGAINGSIQFCNEPGATVTFTFIGVAVWILSPLWPYNLTFQAALDSNNVTLVNVTDPNAPYVFNGAVTTPSRPVWGAINLANIQHTLILSDANSAAGYHDFNVDGFMYTAVDAANASSTSFTLSSTTNSSTSNFQSTSSQSASSASSISTTSSTSSSQSSPSQPSSNSTTSLNILATVLGTVLGVVGVGVLIFLAWFCGVRQSKIRYPQDSAYDEMQHTVNDHSPHVRTVNHIEPFQVSTPQTSPDDTLSSTGSPAQEPPPSYYAMAFTTQSQLRNASKGL